MLFRSVEVLQNGGDYASEVAVIRVRRVNDHDDPMTDYSAGVFCDNLTQALRIAKLTY